MLEEKIKTGHSGHGYFRSKSFNSLLSRNMTYSKKDEADSACHQSLLHL